SVWWLLTDHQLKAINPASVQWTSRTGKSQTGCFPFERWFGAIGDPSMFRRAERIVAALARLIEAVVGGPDLVEVTRLGGGIDRLCSGLKVPRLADKYVLLLPDFGFRARFADLGAGPRREQARALCRRRCHRRGLRVHHSDVRLAGFKLAMERLHRLSEAFHGLVAVMHDL